MQSGTVIWTSNHNYFGGELRGKLNFPSSTKFFYNRSGMEEIVIVGNLDPHAPYLDSRSKVSVIYIGHLPDTEAVSAGGEFGDQEAEIFIDTRVRHYRIKPRSGCMAEVCVDYVDSEVPVLISVDMYADIDALNQHIRAGNWKAAAPLADKIVSAIDSQLQ